MKEEIKYQTEYKDYSRYVAIMISTDIQLFNDKSAVYQRMIEYRKLYKELHIIVFSTKKIQPIEFAQDSKIYSTNSLIKLNYVRDARKLGRKIVNKINKQIPILVTCQDPFETALAGKCLADIRFDSELLIQIHTDLFSPYFIDKRIGFKNSLINRFRLFISKHTLNNAQAIRVVSKKIADSLVEKGYDENKIIIKPITVNVDYIKNTQPSFNLKQKYPQWNKIILMVSRLESEKNIDMAIKALSMINKDGANKIGEIGMVIVGSGSKINYLKEISHKLAIDKNIDFVGWQTDTVSYYKGCDVFLHTSWFEGYGMVLLEAYSAGCKIVSTDVGIARDVKSSIVDWNVESIEKGLIQALK